MKGHRHLGAVDVSADNDHDVKRLAGWSIREAAGTAAAATVRIRHADGSAGATGQIVAEVELAADGSESFTYGDATHLPADNNDGFYVEVVNGTVEGVLFEAL